MTFRSAMLVTMVALVAAVLAASGAASAWLIGQRSRADAAAELVRSRKVFDALLAWRFELYGAQAQVTAEEPRIKAVLAADAITAETIFGVAADVRQSLKTQLFWVTDSKGMLIADADDLDAPRQQAPDEKAALWVRDGRVLQVVSRSVAFAQTEIGRVVLGWPLDDRFAATVAEQTSSQVIIFGPHGIVGSAGFGPGRVPTAPQLEAALAAASDGEVALFDEPYLASVGALEARGGGPLRYAVLRSLSAATITARRLMNLLFTVLGAGVLAAALAAGRVSRQMSRPLSTLVEFTRRLGAGELAARAPNAGPLEVKTLAGAMNDMVTELSASRERLAATERVRGEMEIARTIQASLLPRLPALEGLQVAAHMQPATEIGGDYYDVIRSERGGWVAIGDVAGHGLPAGLVMLMVQNAVQALAAACPGATARELVIRLNALLFDTVRRRLGRDEHVTFSLFKYLPDGSITFAGAHEPVIVLRAATGRCELVETPGVWLGTTRDATRRTVETDLKLEPGDTVVLYTDGVTEAANAAQQRFGLERLCASIESAARAPVEALCSDIVEHVRRWMTVQEDDLTVVVLRYEGVAAHG